MNSTRAGSTSVSHWSTLCSAPSGHIFVEIKECMTIPSTWSLYQKKLGKEYTAQKCDLTLTFLLHALGQLTSVLVKETCNYSSRQCRFAALKSFTMKEVISPCTKEIALALKLWFVFFWKVRLVCWRAQNTWPALSFILTCVCYIYSPLTDGEMKLAEGPYLAKSWSSALGGQLR